MIQPEHAVFTDMLQELVREGRRLWDPHLKGIVLFGSTVRQLKRETDVDLLLVMEGLPPQRRARLELFDALEERLASHLSRLRALGFHLEFSPLLRTPREAARFSPLYLDMTHCCRILLDQDGLLARVLERTARYIEESGAHRVERGLYWYWVLKPGLKSGEEFEMGWAS